MPNCKKIIYNNTASQKNKKFAAPFIKWLGGKRRLLPYLTPYIPTTFNHYIEPFLGGGAMFFYLYQQHLLGNKQAILSDSNAELMRTYKTISHSENAVIDLLKCYPRNAKYYYHLRRKDYESLNDIALAARTIYLNKNGFNGLYRVNSDGKFNVPFGGDYQAMKNYPFELIHLCAAALQRQKLLCNDYKIILRNQAKPGDFVFLDPPYYPIKPNSFIRYTKNTFQKKEHYELADEVARLKKIGCRVLLTNTNCPTIRDLYPSYEKKIISVNGSLRGHGYQEHLVITANI